MIKVAINGYGRIGRLAHRIILERFFNEIEIVAINAGDSTDIKGWMYLLKYDSSYGILQNHTLNFQFPISNFQSNPNDQNLNVQTNSSPAFGQAQNDKGRIGYLIIDDKEVPVFSQKDPSLLPWKDLEVDVVIEATGAFRKEEDLKKHLAGGAKSVVLSAPIKEGQVPIYVLSVNTDKYGGEKIISNASCTTNCIAPVAKIMEGHFGIEKAMMTTIHGYTSDQRLQDGGHKDYRRARAAAENIIPTSTGATTAAAKAMPELSGKFTGLAIRVPVITGSLSDFTFLLSKETTKEEVNEIFKKEAENPVYKNILEVTEDPIVSSDIIGNPASATVDLSLTQVIGGNMVKVIAWYDNEWGYANRLLEEVVMVGKNLQLSSR